MLIEYAKNLDAQMKEIAENERPRARRLIVDSASQVVRYASAYKKDALDMLKKYKPSAALRAEDILRITYEDAVNQANEAIGSQDWPKAIALLKAAVRKADPARNPEKANLARYSLAFCYYKNNQLYEADVLGEHLARRYPQGGVSPKASEIAMQSLADAYNTYTEIDRLSDLDRLVKLAIYMVETWPEKEEADTARMNLSQIYSQTGPVRRGDQGLDPRCASGRSNGFPPRTGWDGALAQEPRAREPGRGHGFSGRGPEGDRRPEGGPQGPPRCPHRPDRPRLHRQRR